MRTDENLTALSNELQKNCGDMYAACKAVGVSAAFVLRWIKDDKEACEILEESQRVGWMGLESEATRRATGYDEDVYYKGESVGVKKVYSDSLLAKLMEARVPAYTKKVDAAQTFNGPTQINIMPRAETFDDWLKMKDETLRRRALVAPVHSSPVPDILQGDFIENVNPMAKLKGLL